MAWDTTLAKLDAKRQAEIICGKFTIGDTKASIKFSLGGLADKGVYKLVSKAAYELLNEVGVVGNEVTYEEVQRDQDRGNSYRIEHVIPTEVVYNHLSNLNKKGSLTPEYVRKLIEGRLVCAIITEQEDLDLNKKYKSSMPDGWNFDTGDLMARYKAVGIEMYQWN